MPFTPDFQESDGRKCEVEHRLGNALSQTINKIKVPKKKKKREYYYKEIF